MKKLSMLTIIAATLTAAPVTTNSSNGVVIDRAEARVGRPLTPGSVAGVNRRVHRRTARAYYYSNGHRYYY